MTSTQAKAESPAMSVDEVAAMTGLAGRTIRRYAQDKASAYFAARIFDGINRLRFRREDIEAIIHGPKAKVLPMRGAR